MINNQSAPTKLMLYSISPMTKEGFERWGQKQKKHINKSLTVHKPNLLLREIPPQVFETDTNLAEYLLQYLPEGTYRANGWMNGATRTRIKFTKTLFNIEIYDTEKGHYKIFNTRRLNYYGIRRNKNKQVKQ